MNSASAASLAERGFAAYRYFWNPLHFQPFAHLVENLDRLGNSWSVARIPLRGLPIHLAFSHRYLACSLGYSPCLDAPAALSSVVRTYPFPLSFRFAPEGPVFSS